MQIGQVVWIQEGQLLVFASF